MAQILKHSLSEIKPQKTKLFNPVSTMQRINRALAEIINFDGDDHGLYDYLVNRYLQTLDLYHINGRAGSLLPKEDDTKAQPTAAQVIAAANAAYDAYAQHVPFGCGGSLEAAAIGHQAFQTALAGGAA